MRHLGRLKIDKFEDIIRRKLYADLVLKVIIFNTNDV